MMLFVAILVGMIPATTQDQWIQNHVELCLHLGGAPFFARTDRDLIVRCMPTKPKEDAGELLPKLRRQDAPAKKIDQAPGATLLSTNSPSFEARRAPSRTFWRRLIPQTEQRLSSPAPTQS